jgi:pyruvate dehydrogenase E1 component
MDRRTEILSELARKVLWLSTWTIHNANRLRANPDGLKVGGHQSSSASLAAIMTALYFAALRPEDRVAVKPHASPCFHAIQYLLGHQTRAKLENFRGFGGVQSYPSRTKDIDDVDFSTGSVGLGVAQTVFASMAQDFLKEKGWAASLSEGKMVALVGDAELDEGNVYEALVEGWKHGLRNTWWIIDYNRQSLDGVIHEGLASRLESVFATFGWDVVVLKYGALLEDAFARPGGAALRDWIDNCPNELYSALTFQGGAAWRQRLTADLGANNAAAALIASYDDAALARLMTNLGGHDLPSLLDAFAAARRHDRPVCFIAYTIKGAGLPLAGHKDNHSGLMTEAQMEAFRAACDIRAGHEWDKFEGLATGGKELQRFLDDVPFAAKGMRRYTAPVLDVPPIAPPAERTISTQAAFGVILNEIGRGDSLFADRIATMSPDVTVSTNLGPWVNRRKLFARQESDDLFRTQRIPSTYRWDRSPRGQHVELGIAESNLFLALSAFGLTSSLFGERIVPIGTVYDPFILRGADQLNYACYQDARFILVATPSGITLAPEGGAHQSIGTPLVGMSQPGLSSFEPAFADELALILRWAFEHVQRDGKDGGSVYLRLSSRALEQPTRNLDAAHAADIVQGGYWLRPPGPAARVVIAYAGAVAPEAIEAVGLLAEDRRDVGLLAVTSADLLQAGWTQASRDREAGDAASLAHVERLLAAVPADCAIVTVTDAHPVTLGWIGAVAGHRVRALGVDAFGQTGTIADLYRHYGLDVEAILRAAQAIAPGRPIRHLARA